MKKRKRQKKQCTLQILRKTLEIQQRPEGTFKKKMKFFI